LPGLNAGPEFEGPRVSGLLAEFWLKRWKPLLERAFELILELPFPGRGTSRPFPIDLPFAVAPALPRAEKKC
jgi:hypothetical protein